MATIVVVDDETLITDFLSFFLKAEGYTVHVARDGRSALELIGEVRPDVVLTDYMMPAMSGLELAQALRASPKLGHIPVVLASAAQGVAARLRGDLFAAVLDKPYAPARLIALLRELTQASGNAADGVLER
jgi:CheY-like chemotaxis protein